MPSSFSWLEFFTGAGIPLREAEKYSMHFDDNRMKPEMLPDLNKDLLNDLGITLIGDILAILKHRREIEKQLERGQLTVSSSNSAASRQATSSQDPRPAARTSAPRAAPAKAPSPAASHKAKRRHKSSRSKDSGSSDFTAMVSPSSVAVQRPSCQSAVPLQDPDSEGSEVDEQPRRVVAQSLASDTTTLTPFHSDRIVSNASQTTVIRRSEQPVSALDRLGNGTIAAAATSARSARRLSSQMESDDAQLGRRVRTTETAAEQATRLVQSVSSQVVSSPAPPANNSKPLRQTVSVRMPATTGEFTAARNTSGNGADEDSSDDDDDGRGLRRIVHSVSASSKSSAQQSVPPRQQVQMARVVASERGHAAAAAAAPLRAPSKIRRRSSEEPVIMRVVPLMSPRKSPAATYRREHQTVSLSMSRRNDLDDVDYNDDGGDDEYDEEDVDDGDELFDSEGRHIAVGSSRRALLKAPAAKRSPTGMLSSTSRSSAVHSKSNIKSRLGTVSTDEAPRFSSSSSTSSMSSRVSLSTGRSSVFGRLGGNA